MGIAAANRSLGVVLDLRDCADSRMGTEIRVNPKIRLISDPIGFAKTETLKRLFYLI